MPRRVILGLVPSCNFFASPDQIERGSFPVMVEVTWPPSVLCGRMGPLLGHVGLMFLRFCCERWFDSFYSIYSCIRKHPSRLLRQYYHSSPLHVILLTILTLRAGGRFDSHFWTQSGAPSPYLAFRAPPRFQAIYGVESVPRFQPIFGIRSAPPPAFKLYMVLKAWPPPLSTHIWHSERPPAFKLYMVLRACPAFNPYLAFRAPPRFQAIFCVESGPIFSV